MNPKTLVAHLKYIADEKNYKLGWVYYKFASVFPAADFKYYSNAAPIKPPDGFVLPSKRSFKDETSLLVKKSAARNLRSLHGEQ